MIHLSRIRDDHIVSSGAHCGSIVQCTELQQGFRMNPADDSWAGRASPSDTSIPNQDIEAHHHVNYDTFRTTQKSCSTIPSCSGETGIVWLSRVLGLIMTLISKSIKWTITKGIMTFVPYHRIYPLSLPNSMRIRMITTIELHMAQNMYHLIPRASNLLLKMIVTIQILAQ
jgi:hypothetical protein